jgi:C-terminal processing protease CtpA/Prc
MRCYPSDFMPFTFVPFIKLGNKPFVEYTFVDINTPGLFKTSNPIGVDGQNSFKGKVVVIVNEITQSQAEYTAMAFQSSPNVTVIGSTTAGADGDVSIIFLPGGIKTMISGLGIMYPDGTETQRKGIIINYKIIPSIQSIKESKDELLQRAEKIIQKD